ncbi:NUDIX domain-containing protein [Frankia sp. CNm7]|uniref:NUDIX domain-containing protein n=1 Tax=Frankia nepalensis TaxID=1836974 RepID=A0A937URI2_9ACTN|nr:NUDIX domain-containing protein [Frankia nepalensis]MBL7495675.1 NUDIX domain-containing protein [Frankia nepalensis]MBL7510259.1 NUDIX domain-containing protein [Frankia nepalensis]MBL7520485.1 NUDIX domain-containing protein [Frankia nepalensis]MBL7631168.1 NUDIX domain-containing protein [Frankia nepalensis]
MGDDELVPRTRVFGERSLYDNPWVRLVQVDVEPPDGRRFWHHVVRLQTVAMAIVLDGAGRVLLLRRHRFATGEVGWEAPGGIVRPGETAEAAAARETLEETGWRPHEPARRIAAFQPMPGMVDTPHEVFLFQGAERVGEPTDREEAAIVGWLPLGEVPELVRRGEVLGSGSLVGLLAVLAGMVSES